MTQVNPNAQKIRNAIQEIVHHLDRIDIENEGIKSIIKDLKESINVNPKVIRRVAKAIASGKTGETVAESIEVSDLLDSISN